MILNNIKLGSVLNIARVGSIKGGSAALGFLLSAMIMRLLDVNSAGVTLYFLGFIPVLIVFFRFGLSNIILREFSAHGTSNSSQKLLNNSVTLCLMASTLGCILIYYFLDHLLVFSGRTDYKLEATLVLACIPLFTVFSLFSFTYQAKKMFFNAAFFQNLGVSFFFLSITIFLTAFYISPTIFYLLLFYTAAAVIVFLCALFSWYSSRDTYFNIDFRELPKIIKKGSNLWLAGSITVLSQWGGVIIGGSILINSDVAILSFTQRSVLLITFLLMVSDTLIAPRYAKLWGENDIESIKSLAITSSRILTILAIPIFLIIIYFGEVFLSYFGIIDSKAYLVLTILAAGQLINTCTGSIGFLLNMTNHDAQYRNLTIISSVISMLLVFLLSKEFGLIGAAIGVTSTAIIQNSLTLLFIRKHLGIWTIG